MLLRPDRLFVDDHDYGASDYVAIGAKLVVPDAFTYYWRNIPNVQFATATYVLPVNTQYCDKT